MYDEMAIHQVFCWNPTTKSYMGYETLPHEGNESERTASHLYVFLLKGLVNGWEYPVAYYFTQTLSNETICLSLRDVLKTLSENGIYPSGIAFDGLIANFAAAKALGACLDVNDMRPNFKHPFDEKIVHVFPDIPHMLKLVRNKLHDLQEVYVPGFDIPAKWKYFSYLHQYQVEVGLRLFGNCISNKHVDYGRHTVNSRDFQTSSFVN